MSNIKEYVYKTTETFQLKLKVFTPLNWTKNDRRTAVVFFFGGGWIRGHIEQFKPQSEYLSSKGIVSITPQYRIKNVHGTNPLHAVQDAKDAIKWIFDHSSEIGIDRERIVVGGGSAGAHLAACTAILKDAETDKQEIWKIPKAMLLFNPVTDTTESGYGSEKIGDNAIRLSPFHHITPGVPLSIVFHGTSDTIVPYEQSVKFSKKMMVNGNECNLISYEGETHGFFNKERSEKYFWDTIIKAENFLRKHGFVSLGSSAF